MESFEQNLAPGETVVFRTRLHGLLILNAILYAIVFGLVVDIVVFALIFLAEQFGPKIHLFLPPIPIDFAQPQLYLLGILPFAFLGLIRGLLNYRASEIVLTNQRIFIRIGFFRRRRFELDLNKPDDFVIRTSLSGRMFGYKTLYLFEANTLIRSFTFVDSADEIEKKIAEHRPHPTVAAPSLAAQFVPPGAPAPRPSVTFAAEVEYPEEYTKRLLREASDHIKHGNYEAARRIVERLVQSNPDNANVWYMAGYLSSSPEKRREAYQRALEINPKHKQARQGLAALE